MPLLLKPRLVDFFRRTDALKAFAAFQQSQWLPPAEIEQQQWAHLQALLAHAYAQVPYYRRAMDQAGLRPAAVRTWDDFQRLPTLTKADMKAQPDAFRAADAARYEPRPKATSGSTGEPLRYWVDRRSHSAAWGFIFRAWHLGGWQPGDRVVFLGGSSLVPSVSAFKKQVYVALNNWLLLSAFDMDAPHMAAWARQVKRFGARIMYSYASSAYLFAKFLEEQGIQDVKFDAVFTTAEVLHPTFRETIARVFGCEVFDTYGGVDGAGFAFECERHDGLHIVCENGLVEILREDGSAAADGEEGDVVTTDLFNYAMPFIRYHVGDRAAMTRAPCACGRGLPRLVSIQGRTGDFVVNKAGEKIHEMFFGYLFRGMPGVRQYYVEQLDADTLRVRVVPEPGQFGARPWEEAAALIRKKFQGMTVDIALAERLPLRANGKFRCVVNHMASRSELHGLPAALPADHRPLHAA